MKKEMHIRKIIEEKEIAPGDLVEVTADDGRVIRGIAMPHHEFSQDDILTVKLGSGYNVGIHPGGADAIKLISKSDRKKSVGRTIPTDEKKRTISVVSTGGTIASYVDYRTGAVHPAISAEELVFSVPELMDICNVRAEVLYSILSENMRHKNWKELAETVAKHLNEGSTGCVIPHGTDTMGYTAAALSFSLPNLNAPVVLVGSQRSSDRPSSDATGNLLASVRLCIESDLGEVVVLMHSSTDDGKYTVHRGTRIRKNHSSRRDAFQSVNEPPIGTVDDGTINLAEKYTKRSETPVQVDAKFDEDVILIQFYPGMSPERFSKFTKGAKGVVIAGTGLGHVSQDVISSIRELTGDNVPVCITTQCIWGSVNLNVYSTGRDMISAGAIPLGDMLSETAFVKLSWVLAHTTDMNEIREMMLSNLRSELSDRRLLDG